MNLNNSGGSVLDGDDSEKAELLAQKERLEQQNAELDEIIQNFSQYIQTTVLVYICFDSIVL